MASDLQNKSMDELERMAKDMGMKHSGMKKEELVQMLEQHRSEGGKNRMNEEM